MASQTTLPTGRTPTRGAAAAAPEQPNELTAICPGFSGRVTNRPTATGAGIETFNEPADSFNEAEEQERQEDA